MGHEPNLIDIYSASWGPTDDGKVSFKILVLNSRVYNVHVHG